MSVKTQHDKSKRQLVISISGSFDFSIHTEFRKAYKDIEPDSSLHVTVDLLQADYMDSAALGMLLLVDEHFKEQRINITNCSDYVKQILDIVNFSQKFNIG